MRSCPLPGFDLLHPLHYRSIVYRAADPPCSLVSMHCRLGLSSPVHGLSSCPVLLRRLTNRPRTNHRLRHLLKALAHLSLSLLECVGVARPTVLRLLSCMQSVPVGHSVSAARGSVAAITICHSLRRCWINVSLNQPMRPLLLLRRRLRRPGRSLQTRCSASCIKCGFISRKLTWSLTYVDRAVSASATRTVQQYSIVADRSAVRCMPRRNTRVMKKCLRWRLLFSFHLDIEWFNAAAAAASLNLT